MKSTIYKLSEAEGLARKKKVSLFLNDETASLNLLAIAIDSLMPVLLSF